MAAPNLTRRSFLGSLAATSLLAACGSSGDPSGDSATTSTSLASSGSVSTTSTTTTTEPADSGERLADVALGVIFSLNVHDWTNPDLSAATVHRVIDIHEAAEVPVDVYVTDAVFRGYEAGDPALVERLASSPVVGMGYHHRPPYPWYNGFDTVGLSDLSEPELETVLRRYATEAIDLSTGDTTGEPGGFAHVAEVLGVAPTIVSSSTSGPVSSVLHRIYGEYGATMAVQRPAPTFGATVDDLFVRPETTEIKLYEHVRDATAPADLLAASAAEIGEGWIGVKYHENNFYWTNTPFWPVYWTDSSKQTPLAPPWDLSAGHPQLRERPQEDQDAHWQLWTDTVTAAADEYTVAGVEAISAELVG